jgi:hypothetical protein
MWFGELDSTQRTKGAGTFHRAVRSQAFARIPGGRHMECAYYFVDGTWNMPTCYFEFCRMCPTRETALPFSG